MRTITVITDDSKNLVETEPRFVTHTLSILNKMIVQFEEYGVNEITIEVRDVNAVIEGKELDQFITEGLAAYGYNRKNIYFSYGNGNWMTVSVRDPA